jgi:hypothetical protein
VSNRYTQVAGAAARAWNKRTPSVSHHGLDQKRRWLVFSHYSNFTSIIAERVIIKSIARNPFFSLSLSHFFYHVAFCILPWPAFFSHSHVQKNFINLRHFSGELTEPHSLLACLFAPAAASSANNIARALLLVFQFNAVPSHPPQRCSATSSTTTTGRALQRHCMGNVKFDNWEVEFQLLFK